MLNSHKSVLSKYLAGYKSDDNKHSIFSELIYWKQYYLFNSQVQPAMPMLLEYSGSLARSIWHEWILLWC